VYKVVAQRWRWGNKFVPFCASKPKKENLQQKVLKQHHLVIQLHLEMTRYWSWSCGWRGKGSWRRLSNNDFGNVNG
jgi:hypothetical protein